MTMSVNLIEGNILTPPTRNENTIICHQVNCRAAMGAGLARQIRDKWPVVFDEYVKVCNPKKLGDFQVVQVAELLEAYTAKERSALDCAEEMADVMEVLYAMGKTCAVSKREIEQVRSQKAAEKGTFSKKIFLVSTDK